jgi:hypothetical protein
LNDGGVLNSEGFSYEEIKQLINKKRKPTIAENRPV